MLESRREFFKHLTLPKNETRSIGNATAAKNPLERTASRRDFIKVLGIVATALAIPEDIYARKRDKRNQAIEKEGSFITPEQLRKMVLTDNSERVFIRFPNSPRLYEITDRSQNLIAFARGAMTPETEKMLEQSDEFTKIHTHPLGIYGIAGYTPDEIDAAREGLMPVPLSMPPSIPDLLSAKIISQIEGMGEPIRVNQEIYGTDGIWRFKGGADSVLLTEIEQVNQELVNIFSDFRKTLPANLQGPYDKIIHLAENEGDARQGFVCRNINELTKNPTFAPYLPLLEEKLAKLSLEYKETFALMEEMTALSIAMTHPEQRDAALQRYLAIVEKEGFEIKFEPYKIHV
ncbi:MAG: hypothetical protein WAV15_03225 [Minisyncoccia bacterium]